MNLEELVASLEDRLAACRAGRTVQQKMLEEAWVEMDRCKKQYFDMAQAYHKEVDMRSGELAHIKTCGCWVVYIAQGVMILPCYGHETSVLTAIEKPFGVVNDTDKLAVPGD